MRCFETTKGMGYDSTLQYNTGVQDRLLQDPHNSLFVHPGYTKSTLAQQSLSDLRPVQDTKYFGNVIKFTIPAMADLLGPVDLMLDLAEAMPKKQNDADDTYDDTYVGWVETMGYAMIDYATLSIGQNEIERISGDQMQLMNELMTGTKGKQVQTVGTTGRSLVALRGDQLPDDTKTHALTHYKWRNRHYKSPRLVLDHGKACKPMKLCVPLPFFFTKSPQDCLPLAMFSGCQNVTIEVRLRPIEELLIRGSYRYSPDTVGSYHKNGSAVRVNHKRNIHQKYYHRGNYMKGRGHLHTNKSAAMTGTGVTEGLIEGAGVYYRATNPLESDTQPTKTDDATNAAERLREIQEYAPSSGHAHRMRPMFAPNVTADIDTFGTQESYGAKEPPPVEWADGPIKKVELRLHEVMTTSLEAEVHQNEPQVRLQHCELANHGRKLSRLSNTNPNPNPN